MGRAGGGIPLADASSETVFSEHFLEHIDYPRSAKSYARWAHRVPPLGWAEV
ncbi:hypothetical protein [Streptomyces lavendulae]|uniref:hypothetical protein n=1 Tax=Streptomyces lavendulae TaxID=1914 RepID=UPI0024A18188|nr:hypothetical protein Slala01_53750 [Streptomyces lavendulae subsp. lavendulae]GLX28364.1 hypothetical protein Slala02_41840 [Streptomyces lavendulae subsp. lavendulae]